MYKSNNAKLVCFNTHGYTGVEQVTSLCNKFKFLKILPGQNFLKYEGRLYRKINIENKSLSEIFKILNLSLKKKNGKIWAGLFKYAKKEDIKKYDKKKHYKNFLKEIKKINKVNLFDYKYCYIKSYFYTVYKREFNNNYKLAYYSGNICLAYDKKDFKDKVYILNVFCPIEFWLSNISTLRFWNAKQSIGFWLVNNLYLLHFSKSYKNFQNLNVKNFLNVSIKNNSINLKKLKINNEIEKNFEIGQTSFQLNRVNNWINNSKLFDEIYKDYGLYKLAKNFQKWSGKFIRDQKIIKLLEGYKEFFQSSTTTNLDWIDPISEKILFYIEKKLKLKDEYSFNFNFYHEYYTGGSFDYRKIIRLKKINFLGNLEKQIKVPNSIYHLKVCCAYLYDVLQYFKSSNHSTISIKESSIYAQVKNYMIFNKDKDLIATFKELDKKI